MAGGGIRGPGGAELDTVSRKIWCGGGKKAYGVAHYVDCLEGHGDGCMYEWDKGGADDGVCGCCLEWRVEWMGGRRACQFCTALERPAHLILIFFIDIVKRLEYFLIIKKRASKQ